MSTVWKGVIVFNYGLIVLMLHEKHHLGRNINLILFLCENLTYQLFLSSENEPNENVTEFTWILTTIFPGRRKIQNVIWSMENFKINIFGWNLFYSKGMDLYLLAKNYPSIPNPQINVKKWNGFFFAAHSRQGGILQYDVREFLQDKCKHKKMAKRMFC